MTNLHASPELTDATPDAGNVVDLQSRRPRRAPSAEEPPRFDESSVTLEMKAKMLAAITQDTKLEDADIRLANLLMFDYRDRKTGRCSPDRETLAGDMGCSPRKVDYCVERLQDRTWLIVKHRFNNSNLYYFNWNRLRALDELPRVFDVLLASGSTQAFERTWTELGSSFGDEVAKYVKRISRPGHDKSFVDELLTQYPRSKARHYRYGRELSSALKKLSASRWALNTALSNLLMRDNKGFLPEPHVVVKEVSSQQQKLSTLLKRIEGAGA